MIRKIVFGILVISVTTVLSADIYSEAAAGNKRFLEGKYEEAAEAYDRALKIENKKELLFNKGLAEYKMKKYGEAVKTLEASGGDIDSLRNAGNSYKRIGDNEQEQQKKNSYYQKALEKYKEAIIKDRHDMKSKKNYEIVKKLIKEDQNKENNKDEKNQDKQENKDKNDKQNQQNKENKGDKKQDNKEDKNESSKKNENKKEDKQNQTNEANPEEQKKEMKQQEVMGILKELEKNEKEDLKNNMNIKGSGKNEKYDW